jgi:serine/threonine protein kinase
VLHLDIKPQNFLISTNNQVKLADFEIFRKVEHVATTLIGMPFYMGPEIFFNQPFSFPIDVWSLECVLYERVTGQKPFDNHPVMFLHNIMNNQLFPITSNVSDNVKNLIFDVLNKNPPKIITLDQIQHLTFLNQFFPLSQQQEIPPQCPISQSPNH